MRPTVAGERAAAEARPPCLLSWLRSREQTGTVPRRSPFEQHALPARLRLPVEALLDEECLLLHGVLLGFNRQGSHLVSYSTSGGHTLHVWRFDASALPSPSLLQASVPLFAGHIPAAVDGPFGEEPVALTIRVCESVDGSTLLVYGCPLREAADENSHGNTAPNVEGEVVEAHLTALEAPWTIAPGAQPAVAHYRYTSLPGLFAPALCMLAGKEAGQLRLLLPTADGVQEVQLSLTAGHVRFRLLRSFEVEKLLARVLAAPLAAGHVLIDFTIRVVDTSAGGGEPTALLLVIAVLEREGMCRPLEMLLSLQGGTARVASTRELRSQARPLSGLAAYADARCDALRQSGRGPLKRLSALPHCLDNAAVVSHGRSAAVLRHPTLPLEIAGFVRPAGE